MMNTWTQRIHQVWRQWQQDDTLPLSKIHPQYRRRLTPVIWICTTGMMTGLVGNRFYEQPELAVGTRSPMRIVAPYNGHFEDQQTTEAKRQAIRLGVVPVLRDDPAITEQIHQNLDQFIQMVDQYRQRLGPFPLVPEYQLNLSSQQLLRSAHPPLWNQLWQGGGSDEFGDLSPLAIQTLDQLTTYRRLYGPAPWGRLKGQFLESRRLYQQIHIDIKQNISPGAERDYLEQVLTLNAQQWQKDRLQLQTTLDRITTQGIAPGVMDSQLLQAVQKQLGSNVSNNALASQFLESLLQPNLVPDSEETKRRAEQAALALEPIWVSAKQGEVIVEAGEVITQDDFALLDGFGLSRRRINWGGLVWTTGLVVIAMGGLTWRNYRLRRAMRCRDQMLLGLLSLSVPLLVVMRVPYPDLAAAGMLVSSFYGPVTAVTHVLVWASLLGFTSEKVIWGSLIASTGGGLLAAALAGRLRSREDLALLGGAVGLVQGSLHLIASLSLSASAGAVWNVLLLESILFGLSGVLWVIVALGLSPYLERIFDLLTPIRLAELSNPNRPLLKRLALEAPGTFQHTMFVASLAEAAARELRCNVELVRAGTLYHDIGKMHDPLGFIENQMGGINKHDQLNDPWQSADIIKKHVSEGLVMAKKYGLPKAIRDFIPEHQGTLMISYFFFQAKQQATKAEQSVDEQNFRYDGPIPQSRESGIMMLADGCEAALRSLKDATPEQALVMVQKIFRARWRDQQLAESGLQENELPIIADVFIRVWQQYNHQRIAYPIAALDPQEQRSH